MSKAVLIAIRPQWCEDIVIGKKTLEIRKTAPKIETPFKCYIYCTKEERGVGEVPFRRFYQSQEGPKHFVGGTVICEFVCDKVYKFSTRVYLGGEQKISDEEIVLTSCVSRSELRAYEGSHFGIFGWHISDLDVYDTPKPLSIFHRPCQESLYCESCAMYREHDALCGNAALQITRPPQSWCYVEEIV